MRAKTGNFTQLILLWRKSLMVHPYTHRDDALILASSPKEPLQLIFATLKVDGVFSDQPLTTV